MADSKEDELRTLRRLAKNYGIRFKRPADKWPDAHSGRFRDVLELGNRNFSTYSENVTVRSSQEPWTRQIKSRTRWLVSRACDLAMNVQPKESGWRLGLENDVMHRFLVEVACPNCRARIWRSEIEASNSKPGSKWVQALEERRKNRRPCQCPPETRPQDYYEIGTSQLFDDRVEEIVILDSALQDLPKKKLPDRTFGLKSTEKVDQLLMRLSTQATTIAEVLEVTPFKSALNPPIFPFLILEAKADSSKNGFHDIQTQTAFPIWKFLTLQRELQLKTRSAAEEPLVWFLANRGSEWKVYGCYVDGGDTPRHNIHPLWGGDLMTHDGALQLILIIDYIADWARDIYRPSILRGLKSLATGKDYDEVSLDLESNVYSIRDRISDWIRPPTSTANFAERRESIIEESQQQPDAPSPQVEHMTNLRMVGRIEYLFECVNFTEQSMATLLNDKVAGDLYMRLLSSGKLIAITQDALDQIEFMWTGKGHNHDSLGSMEIDTEFYVVFLHDAFFKYPEIVKELISVAFSKHIFTCLQQSALLKGLSHLANPPKAHPIMSLYNKIDILKNLEYPTGIVSLHPGEEKGPESSTSPLGSYSKHPDARKIRTFINYARSRAPESVRKSRCMDLTVSLQYDCPTVYKVVDGCREALKLYPQPPE
ncbi:uncharacterized protein F4822DRAFT_423631 [Hypoxylon trugodes]|uniref:uncharacterized protein n=1 Tax=Hypoxylon trugodes TaxID=326681 RepID=UPI002199342D|nr:uncharacterized protein F4822DRAFT_423631 [Hypoxylon trugodes]KAI1393168.1 hypothetical protein F4822DRAFT_423631 [Hypoxylon trugodes]